MQTEKTWTRDLAVHMEGHVPVTLCKLYGLDRIHESLISQAMTIQTVSDEQNGDPQEQRKGAFINLNLNC